MTKHTRILAAAAALLATLPSLSAQNLYRRARRTIAAIADTRATAIGDILTVVINEGTKLKQEDKVNRTNSTSFAARLEAWTLQDNTFKNGVLPKVDARQSRSMDAEAKQEKDSQITAKIAVIVI